MNSEEIAYWRGRESRNQESLVDGLAKLRLGTVIREAHGCPITDLAFNRTKAEYCNLLATVGGNQATIYDDTHLGKYINVVMQFTNTATDETSGGPVKVVAGEDKNLSVVSLVETSVVRLLKGHESEVVKLESLDLGDDRFLVASLGRDGVLKIWDPISGNQLYSSTGHNERSMAFNPSERTLLLVGGEECLKLRIMESLEVESSSQQLPAHTNLVDSILHISRELYGLKLRDGRICVLDYASNSVQRSFRYSQDSECAWCASTDGRFLCITTKDAVQIYDLGTGVLVATHSVPQRIVTSLTACEISLENMHLFVSAGTGYLFRFELKTKLSDGVE